MQYQPPAPPLAKEDYTSDIGPLSFHTKLLASPLLSSPPPSFHEVREGSKEWHDIAASIARGLRGSSLQSSCAKPVVLVLPDYYYEVILTLSQPRCSPGQVNCKITLP